MMNEKNWSMIITSYNARKTNFGSCKYGGNNVELAIIIYTPIVKRIELNGDPKMSDSQSSSSMALAKHVPKIWSPKTFKRNAQKVWINFAIPFQYSSLKINYFIKLSKNPFVTEYSTLINLRDVNMDMNYLIDCWWFDNRKNKIEAFLRFQI